MDTEQRVVGAVPLRQRWWSLLFAVAGIALVPWIVVLALVQPRVAPVGDLALAAGGAMTATTAGLLASAALTLARSPYLVVTTSATATVALCTGFFHVVTGTASHPRAAAVATLVVVVPVVVLCVLVARRRGTSRTTDRVLAVLFVLAAVATVLAWTRAAAAGFDAAYAHHLKLAWVLLDVAEAVVLLTTAAALRRHPARVPATATASGALLCCDVWFNVVGAVGEARTDAVQMAFVSLPLAAVAFVLAVRAVRQVERVRPSEPG